MYGERERARLVRARVDRRNIVLLSRLVVGNFIPFIQAAEAQESSYIRLVNADGRKPARSTVTPAESGSALISDFGGIDDSRDTVNPAPSLVHVRFSCSYPTDGD